MRKEKESKDLKECTFKPRTNGSMPRTNDTSYITERLYNKKKNLETYEKFKKEEEETFKASCTFKPDINKRNPVQSKYWWKKTVKQEFSSKDMEEIKNCTFKPKVNQIRYKDMPIALKYTSFDTF